MGSELETNVDPSDKIVKAACLLDNIIIQAEGLCLDNFNEQLERIINIQGNQNQCHANRGTNSGIQSRKAFTSYFMSPEVKVPCQRNIIK